MNSDDTRNPEKDEKEQPLELDLWDEDTPSNESSQGTPLDLGESSISDKKPLNLGKPEQENAIPLNLGEESPIKKQPITIPDSTSFSSSAVESPTSQLQQDIDRLRQEKQALENEVEALKSEKNQLISQPNTEIQSNLEQLVKEGLRELEQRKQALEISVEQLERRRERIREEMRTTFAGVSQDLAIRVQGFREYLVGSLQDLVASVEQLEFPTTESEWNEASPVTTPPVSDSPKPQFSKQQFQEQIRAIEDLLDQYRSRPDYYGPPWQLRRTFEPIHAERVRNWFFTQGGRGAIRTMGSRLQNILIVSAIISVLSYLYGDRARALILANTPERLGEWRRGLQDCLGISRSDFGPERGVVLFESPEALIQKADRLLEEKELPLVIIDETEEEINLSLLQFPLWIAFAPDPQQMSSYTY